MQIIANIGQRLCVALFLLVVALPLWGQRARKVAPKRTPSKVTAPLSVPTPQQAVSAQQRAMAYELYLSAVVEREKGNDDAMYELLMRAVAIDPQLSAAYWLLVAPTSRLYPHAPERVEQLLLRAVALEPNNKHYVEALAQHYFNHKALDKSLSYYQQLVAMGGRTAPYLQQVYTIQARTERYREALLTLDELERIEGENDEIMVQRIKLYDALDQEQQALHIMDSLIAAQPDNVAYLAYKSSYYIQKNKPQEALQVVEEGLAKDSNHVLLHRSRVAAYGLLEDKPRYAEAMYRFLSLPTDNFMLHLMPVLSYSMKEKDAAVIDVMLRVLAEHLPRVDNREELAEVYKGYLELQVQDKAVLRQHLGGIVKAVPEYTQARLLLLRELLTDTAFAEATALCDEGIMYTPQHPVFYYYKALFQSQAGERSAALATLQQGKPYLNNPNWHTDLVSDYYGIMGDLLYQHGQSKAAWQALDSALVYNGTNAMVLNNYAYYLYLDKQRIAQAKQWSEKAIAVEPDNLYYLDTYIDLLLLLRQTDEAQRMVERALKLAVTASDGAQHAWESAGDVAYLRGQKADALHYWKEAQRHGGDSPTLLKKIATGRYHRQSKKEALKDTTTH